MSEFELRASVLGSFQIAKPEIDFAIEELRDYGVDVLGHDSGSVVLLTRAGLYVPGQDFAPLPSEVGMTPEEVEQQFVERCVKRSDFAIVVNPEGYVGDMVLSEMKIAESKEIPIYTKYPIKSYPEQTNGLQQLAVKAKTLPTRDIVKIGQEVKALRRIGLAHSANSCIIFTRRK